MDYFSALGQVFSKMRYKIAFIALLAVLLPLFLFLSNILVPEPLSINPFAGQEMVALVIAIVFLMSLNWAVLLRNYEMNVSCGKKAGALGTLAAFLTSACPVCQPAWLVWFGLGCTAAFLSEISIYLALASILLLLISLHYSLSSVLGCKRRH
jgi:hypothetical protein